MFSLLISEFPISEWIFQLHLVADMHTVIVLPVENPGQSGLRHSLPVRLLGGMAREI